MKDHGNKTIELDSFLKGSLGRYTELIRLCFQHKWIASLGAVSTVLCTPLPMRKSVGRPFFQGWTHTHTMFNGPQAADLVGEFEIRTNI